ncbi:hypothetical protein EHW97_04125 [Aeromicrobium camelliae]|uniref:Uncharacterized protein n=1 Tax=Aeromicrobium camelliae TaxID=1538144 RepID=A0A3N6X5E7_9ACTN|nr:hypothetical protein [Aeromicrobium camelliae]RQN08898.1 hypothetical protein EHW97_04125 [Aeromicrobium camelliae]
MEEPESPRRVKKVVIRRVAPQTKTPESAPADERRPVATIPRVRRPRRRPRDTEPTPPAAPQRTLADRAATAGRKASAGARLVAELTVAELRHLHWPQWESWLAATVVGAGAGVLMAALGAVATAIVAAVRGVSGGAGAAGFAAVALLSVLVVSAAAFCLRRLGSPRAWTVASLGAVVVTVLVLALFLRPAATAWAFLILPALGALAFLAADRVLDLAERQGDDA